MNPSSHSASVPWSGFIQECLWYFIPLGVLHLAVFAAGILFLAMCPRKQPGLLRKRIERWGLFLTIALLVGSVFNGLWSCLIWGRLYQSKDYVLDFMPFWPIRQSAIDAPWGNEQGRLFGVSLFQLQLVWLAFAAAVWGITILLFRFFLRHPPKRGISL